MKAKGFDSSERFVSQKKYKTITEIMAQEGKSNMEKLQEWFENEKLYKGLVDIKLDAGLGLQIQNTYGKTVEEIKEEYAGELLEMAVAKKEGRYEEIKKL